MHDPYIEEALAIFAHSNTRPRPGTRTVPFTWVTNNTIRELSYFVLYVLLFIKYNTVFFITEPWPEELYPLRPFGLTDRIGSDAWATIASLALR